MAENHQLSFLVPVAARSAHAELVAALGTENNPSQWMTFMQTVTRLLPDILSSGRPTKESIQRSAIGQLGFASWQAMIDAPTDIGGLGWNFSAWKAWRRAWTVVQTYPWLLDQPMTSSEVNNLANDIRKEGVPFPGSPEEMKAAIEARKTAQERRKGESVQALTERAEMAEKALREATARVTALSEQSAQSITQATTQAEQIGTLKAEISALKTDVAALTKDRDTWKTKAQAKPKPPQPAGIWARIVGVFRGRG